MSLKDKIDDLVLSSYKELISTRNYLHQNPELSFQEYNTAKYICSRLDDLEIPYEKGIAGTGVVALIRGVNPNSKCIALRADIDALPIQELSEVDYASKNKGVMHACGHDVHTTCLLGAAKVLNSLKDEFSGTVKLIFQPGEEQLPGGASIMINEGVLRNPLVEKIIALHVYPNLEVGRLGFKSGEYMAACDELYLEIKAKGGHAALVPSSENPIVVFAELLPKLEKYISSLSDKSNEYVFAVGKVLANGATNVIPHEVKAEGTFRTMNEQWRKMMHLKMEAFVKDFLQSRNMYGGLLIKKGYPNLFNDNEFTNSVKNSAVEFLGEHKVVKINKRMTAEDFSFFSQEIPACFFRLGVRNEELGIVHGVHHAQFDIDERALAVGAGVLAYISIKELG